MHLSFQTCLVCNLQGRTSDECMYFSCDDQFGQDKDSDNEQSLEDESNYNIVENVNGNERGSAEGLFLHHITALAVLYTLLKIFLMFFLSSIEFYDMFFFFLKTIQCFQ